VVKGAGMALVLLFTAAADLAKDLAVRLVGLGAILACLGLLCRGRVCIRRRKKGQKAEWDLTYRYPHIDEAGAGRLRFE
jgi:hypothetical protein